MTRQSVMLRNCRAAAAHLERGMAREVGTHMSPLHCHLASQYTLWTLLRGSSLLLIKEGPQSGLSIPAICCSSEAKFPCLLVRLVSALRVSYSMMMPEKNALSPSPFEAQAGMYDFADNGPGAVETRLSLTP